MALQQRNKPSAEFSLASISDLVFLLLIFFMLTSSFVKQAGVKIDLPQSRSTKPSQGRNSVTISADMAYYWNSLPVEKEELEPLIMEVLTDENPDNNVITLKTDKEVTMEHAGYVIGLIAEYEGSVTLATELPPATR